MTRRNYRPFRRVGSAYCTGPTPAGQYWIVKRDGSWHLLDHERGQQPRLIGKFRTLLDATHYYRQEVTFL